MISLRRLFHHDHILYFTTPSPRRDVYATPDFCRHFRQTPSPFAAITPFACPSPDYVVIDMPRTRFTLMPRHHSCHARLSSAKRVHATSRPPEPRARLRAAQQRARRGRRRRAFASRYMSLICRFYDIRRFRLISRRLMARAHDDAMRACFTRAFVAHTARRAAEAAVIRAPASRDAHAYARATLHA